MHVLFNSRKTFVKPNHVQCEACVVLKEFNPDRSKRLPIHSIRTIDRLGMCGFRSAPPRCDLIRNRWGRAFWRVLIYIRSCFGALWFV